MVRKIYFISTVCFICSFNLFSQTLSPNVIASAGQVDGTNEITLEWTLGEVFVKTGQIKTNYLTEGYHQPIIVKSIKDSNTDDPYAISVAPNPVSATLFVTISSDKEDKLILNLMNTNAKILYSDWANSKNDLKEIDMSPLQNGMYILNIRSDNGSFNKSYKISKIR